MKRIDPNPEVYVWNKFISFNPNLKEVIFTTKVRFTINMPEDLLNEMPIGTHEAWRSFYRKIITRL